MSHDQLGNPVSTADAALIGAIDEFVGGMLSYGTGAARILKAASAAPDAPLANAYAAALMMLMESPRGVAGARSFLERAEAAAAGANPREQATIGFVRAWWDGDIQRALELSGEIVARWPRDLVMVRLGQYLAFNTGEFAAMLRLAQAAAPASAETPYVHGMLAFALEQCHLLADAEAEARQALDITEREPWAQHALAHVMLTQGRTDEGARFMAGVAPTWAELNSFMAGHNWWHLALFLLDQGRSDAVLAAYDDHCWAGDRDYSQDQIGAVSLLARLEFAGVDVGERWTDVADHLAARGPDVEQPFLALQYLYGLARAGRAEAEPLLDAIRGRAAAAPAFTRGVWAGAGGPAAEGIAAHLAGDHDRAIEALDEASPLMARIGGSHAQRDLFAQIRLASVLAAGRWVEAQQALELRRAVTPHSVPVNQALARVYAALGLPAQADEARRRAEARLAA